jgi:uncharacterized membrane-anchored protein YitT (DUF2179 family)
MRSRARRKSSDDIERILRDTREVKIQGASIWAFAFGYFAAYVPYSATTKALTSGWIDGVDRVDGFAVAPLSVAASVVGMFVFLTAMRWWPYATQHEVAGRKVPGPTRHTFISGLCTAAIVITTTLAYTFQGVSIVFMMLLMRGGVLILAPIIDKLTGRKTRWFSWVGLALSLGALVVAFSEQGGTEIKLVAAIDVGLYLSSYFVRLRFMNRFAKQDTVDASRRYFVEEQMVATPALLVVLIFMALLGPREVGFFDSLRVGFIDIWSTKAWPYIIFLGVCSQFTGVFGGLVLLDRREATYCVPVNRSSSILAGVVASYTLYAIYGNGAPSAYKLAGAGMIIGAILFLSVPPLLEKRRAARA